MVRLDKREDLLRRIGSDWRIALRKIMLDQSKNLTSGDSYHNISHRSVDLVGIGPSGSGRRDMPELLLARKLCP